MPFGLDPKSVIAGVLFAMFVWPFIMQVIGRVTAGPAPKKAAA
jgi:hypothetical protein